MFEEEKEVRNHRKIKRLKVKFRDRFGKARKNKIAEEKSIEQFEEEQYDDWRNY